MSRTAADIVADAARMVLDDPGQAAVLVDNAEALALADNDMATVARAKYVRAQASAAAGDLVTAASLIHSARNALSEAGLTLEAERTNLGLIHVLNEMGRHIEAIAVGEEILTRLPRLAAAHGRSAVLELGAAAHQNLGVCHELTGKFHDALAHYAHAESQFREVGDDQGVGEVAYDRGLALIALGRFNEALSAFATATDVFARIGMRDVLAGVLTSTGEAHLLLGDFGLALQFLQQARDTLHHIDAPWRDHTNLLATARAYLALNLFPEAHDAYSEVEQWLHDRGLATDRARATWGVALACAGRGDIKGATKALDDAAAAFSFSGHTQWLAAVLIERAGIEQAAGETARARKTADDALRLARESRAPLETARAHVRLAGLSRADVADSHLEAAIGFARTAGLAPVEASALQALGVSRLALGRVAEAREAFVQAIDRFESSRSTLAHEAFLGNFLIDKADSYDGLVSCEVATPGPDQGTRVLVACERARSRTLSELGAGVVHRETRTELAHDQLTDELAAVYSELVADPKSERSQMLRTRAGQLEQRIARSRLDVIGSARSRQDSPTVSVTANIDTIVSYHCTTESITAVVCRNGDEPELIIIERSPRSIVQDLERLAIQWDRCRLGHEFVERHGASLESATQRLLESLYDALLRDIEHRLPPHVPIVVIPHGPLHAIPWAALHDGDGPVIERRAVSVAPSMAVLAQCQNRVPERRPGVTIVGVSDDLAPLVAAECEVVAAHFDNPTRLIDGDATAARVLASIDQQGVVHIAGHGWWRSDNPVFSAIKAADRWLTAAEMMQCDLNGSLVVLSACDSARVRVLPGDEVHGLARAVLGAGASTMVACLWPADDESTQEIMGLFYGELAANEAPRSALQRAQLALRNRRPHPYYWAGFGIIGAP